MIYSRKSSVLSNDISSIFSRTFGNVGNIFYLTFNQIIKSLFSNGEQGFAYDPNDLTTLFQDAAGTVPVTDVGQPVGLMLDKSKGLALGVERLTNGNFANGKTGWADPNGWWSIVNGRAYHPESSAYNEFKQSFASVANKFVKVSFDVQVVKGIAVIGLSAANVSALTFGVGTHTVTMYALPSATSVFFASRVSGYTSEFYIDNVSVKELAGNHAYQTTSASRPILRRNATTGAYYLEFDGTDDFLVTNSINFTSTDKVSLFAGVRKLVEGNFGTIAELSSSSDTNSNGFSFISSAIQGFYFQTGAPVDRMFGTVYGLGSAPISTIVTAQYDRAKSDVSEIKARYNGWSYSSNGLTMEGASASGNFGNYPLYIGRRGGISHPFNGHIYSLIGIGRLTTESETTNLEKAIAKNVGVTL